MENYVLKWSDDLKTYIRVATSFIIEGNVHDLHPARKGDGYEYVSLQEAIFRMLRDKYCVVTFNHIKKAGSEIEGDDEGTNSKSFNSFTFLDEDDKDNIKFFKKNFYNAAYLSNLGLNEEYNNEFVQDMCRIRDSMKQYEPREGKPFLFVLTDVSRFFTIPGRPSDPEHYALTILFQATQIENCKSRILLLVDKANDLPTWFEAENSNPSTRKIYIPFPNADYRKNFYLNEMRCMKEPSDEDKFKKLLSKYIAYTENYSTTKLIQLKEYIEATENGSLERDMLNIEKTIVKFDLGQSEDPWRKDDLVDKIVGLKKEVEKRIKGEDHVSKQVITTLKSAVAGLTTTKKNDRRPKATFFFAGPTGTGKTEITKIIADQVFGKEDSMIRFDMSEFNEEHSDSRLFGAPPGYVGYEAGGELTKAVKENPFSIILFDEIEKASPKIWDKFLQILGDGRITDGKGETIFFTQSIIVFTSNLGITASVQLNEEAKKQFLNKRKEDEQILLSTLAPYLEEGAVITEDAKAALKELKDVEKDRAFVLGINVSFLNHPYFEKYYQLAGFKTMNDCFDAFTEECVSENIKTYFERIGRREVLGRIGEDNIIVYHFISKRNAEKIVDKSIADFQDYLKDDHDFRILLEISDSAREYLKKEATTPSVLDLGGRGVVSTTENRMRGPLGIFVTDNYREIKDKIDRGEKIEILLDYRVNEAGKEELVVKFK